MILSPLCSSSYQNSRCMMISITIYDEASGIGGNKIYLEENNQGVFLDFGKNFGKYGLFYEEFLKNRDTRGIHDLVYPAPQAQYLSA